MPDWSLSGSGQTWLRRLRAAACGFWRGHFSHKNIAGPVMCVIAIFGVYLMRSGQRFRLRDHFAAGGALRGQDRIENHQPAVSDFDPDRADGTCSARGHGHPGSFCWPSPGSRRLDIGSLYSPHCVFDRRPAWRQNLYRTNDAVGVQPFDDPEKPWLGYGLYNFWRPKTFSARQTLMKRPGIIATSCMGTTIISTSAQSRRDRQRGSDLGAVFRADVQLRAGAPQSGQP
jgi:hypothetical protein